MHGDPETTHDVEIDLSQVPLEPAVLTKNIGVPIIVVLTKCDLHTELKVSQLSKIQYHVRNFCLARGAALIYTSGKENLNTHMLYKYLAHRVYNLPFAQAACIVNHHSILIPTGWDSTQKIDIIAEDLPDTLPITAEDDDIMSQVLASLPPTEDETEENFLSRLENMIADSAKST
uniref:Dynein light intermediate chain n=1 Tax=Panagrellus redivivus TaxID=6233 RepID=A0A7E4ZT22_PANRE